MTTQGFRLEKETPVKEFITAVEEIAEEDEREAKIVALVAEGKTREEAEDEVDGDVPIPFKLDDRTLYAYKPTDGQLIFMLAATGRGQAKEVRFASIVNVMLESLRDDDRDYMESRLLTRDRKRRLPLEQVEAIFEYLVSQWFREDVPGGSASV